MSRLLHIEPFSGVAGDMLAAALLDLGAVALDELRAALSTLPLKEEWSVELSTVERRSMAAKLFSVAIGSSGQGHSHRSLREINEIISGADGLPSHVRERALAVFARLASAEAAVHGKSTDAVHFHEVGAADAIIDIVSVAFILDKLAPRSVVSGPVALGTGSIRSAHGTIPVPVPATLKLLEGLPTRRTDIPTELATPTGAALLAEFVTEWNATPSGVAIAVGYGGGSRVVEGVEPSLLRATLIEAERDAEPALGSTGKVAELECWLDDMTGEALAEFAADALDAGALDVAMIPATMKKGRLGTILKILCAPKRAAEFADLVLRGTTSLGVRVAILERRVLDRGTRVVETTSGDVNVKTAFYSDGAILKEKPEHDDIERLAAEHGVRRTEIRRSVEADISKGRRVSGT